jgi:hypothetical protein
MMARASLCLGEAVTSEAPKGVLSGGKPIFPRFGIFMHYGDGRTSLTV